MSSKNTKTEEQHRKQYEKERAAHQEILVARLQGTLVHVQPNHLSWILDAAEKHFREQIKSNEMDQLRIQAFGEVPSNLVETDGEPQQEKIEKLSIYLQQYKNILAFLYALHNLQRELDSQRFAAGVADFFKGKNQ